MNAGDFAEARRGTGRTFRMIQEAQRLVDEGQPVCVVFAWDADWREHFRIGKNGMAVKIVIGLPPDFDWVNMRSKTARPNEAWLVDHEVVESSQQFDAMLRAATYWDDKRAESVAWSRMQDAHNRPRSSARFDRRRAEEAAEERKAKQHQEMHWVEYAAAPSPPGLKVLLTQ